MASSKHLELGIMNFVLSFFSLDSKILMLIPLCLFSLLLDILYLLVYVDDLIITGDNAKLVGSFISVFAHQFSIKDLGQLSYFLGVEVVPNQHGILLS